MGKKIDRLISAWKIRTRKLKQETYALFLAYRHPRTPWYAKILAGIVTAYAFSPIDLIPDFIPVLGYLDDLVLVPLGITLALKLIPHDVMEDCRAESQTYFTEEKPVNWFAFMLIVVIWLVLAYLFFSWIIKLTKRKG